MNPTSPDLQLASLANRAHVVILFASIGSVRWLRPNATRSQPLTACEKGCGLSTWKPLTATDPLILSAGYVRAKIIPRYRWSDQTVHWADIAHFAVTCEAKDFGINIQISPVATSTKFFSSKRLGRMSFSMCFMFYQHQIRKKKKNTFFFFFCAVMHSVPFSWCCRCRAWKYEFLSKIMNF